MGKVLNAEMPTEVIYTKRDWQTSKDHVVDWVDEIGGMEETGSFACAYCGEANVIPLEVSGARVQTYIEDCQVCCRPNHLIVRWSPNRRKVRIEASAEG